jgi:RimJ/RimL family protein N-acetyltransferase
MLTSNVPVLETTRLILRAHRPEDFAASTALWGDPNVTRLIMGKPLTEEEVWSRLLRYAGHWQWLGFGFWAVEEKASGQLIGEMGFADYKREIVPNFAGTPELGYVLASSAQRKGFATEAVKSIVAWGDEHFQAARTVCLMSPDNQISRSVAEKCGYREFQRSSYHGQPIVMLERLAPGENLARPL